ncbi:hypothetical protein D3C78_1771290 [compost metagenome]
MKPPMALSKVDLPQPDGPSRTKRSAGSTSKLTWWVARTTRCGVRYSRLTLSTDNNAVPVEVGLLAAWPCKSAFMTISSPATV